MERQIFEIFTASLVEWLRAENFPMPQPPIQFYPDGSLWANDYRLLGGAHQLIHHKLPGAYGACSFRPLAPFGGDIFAAPQYDLTYPGSYAWMLSEHAEVSLVFYPGICKDISQDEYDLAHVRIMVKLHRKISGAVAGDLAGIVRQWFADIGSRGVFEEAGIASISPTMHYGAKDAGFMLDARGSGQETLNTLYLAILNWGIAQRVPLRLIDLAADRNEAVFTSNLSVPLK